ncbi:MAG: hypothetical protein N3G22_03805, partial [Candidatus Micrarchaeota archaeon]|nr:hypothetical protein [Candidatus Micrarchaeota archaeon]
GASLILPFDSNATIGSGVQDYSPNSYNLSLGGGNPANAPTWQQESCPSGGCYSFDGINDFINGSPISIDSPPSFQLGEERVLNGGLETVTGTPDDGNTDEWAYWRVRNLNNYLFDSTTTSVSGKAVKIYGGTNISSYFNQSIRIVGNTLYNLTLYSRGQGARYAIVSTSNSYYLQNDGSWSATINLFSTGASPGAYSATTKLFALPYGLTNISIRLYPSSVSGETVYYDSISLRQAAGMNGGFEYYFADNIG